jgi:hypothetical protein
MSNSIIKKKRVLFISNGHGEDLNACEVLKALRRKYSDVEAIALPLVGDGINIIIVVFISWDGLVL